MLELDGRIIAEYTHLDPVYVDGMEGILNLGQNFAMMFYRIAPVYSDESGIGLERVPALYVVRPKNSVTLCAAAKGCAFRATLDAQKMSLGLMGRH